MSTMSVFNSPQMLGFDRFEHMLDQLAKSSGEGYPPYNIEKLDEESYQISMAVAGFADADLDIEVLENQLKISGKREPAEDEADRSFLHHGIAQRAFERRFQLAEHIKVTSAKLEHGLLHVKQ